MPKHIYILCAFACLGLGGCQLTFDGFGLWLEQRRFAEGTETTATYVRDVYSAGRGPAFHQLSVLGQSPNGRQTVLVRKDTCRWVDVRTAFQQPTVVRVTAESGDAVAERCLRSLETFVSLLAVVPLLGLFFAVKAVTMKDDGAGDTDAFASA